MRIAVQNPYFLLENQEKNFNGYNFVFLKEYADAVYLTGIRGAFKILRAMVKYGISKKIYFTIDSLNKSADVVVSFNGRPDIPANCPPREFHGMKICHLMDFVFFPRQAEEALEKANVDYVLAYSNHGEQSAFFRQYYTKYEDSIINVPFGYGDRFVNSIPFDERLNKCIALGSVNPVNDPMCPAGMLDDYKEYFKDTFFTHYLRREVVEHRDEWQSEFSDLLPTWPETKNPHYDPVFELNKYTMFLNDAGLMQFPPARTYEGIACGAVMVAEDLPCFRELGFVEGKNCILFTPGNFAEMVKKIRYYQKNNTRLVYIQNESLKLAKKYTHKAVAAQLYRRILNCYENWTR